MIKKLQKIVRLETKSRSEWIETFVFYIILIFNLSIVFATKYFSTLDAGSHAYNANIIYELLFNKGSIFRNYFEFNPEILPNWSSYFFLLIFKPFMSCYTAEKLLFLLFFIFTPLFFRLIVKKFNSGNLWLSNLIFPFTHFSLLYMGFFNFTLGVMFFFIFVYVYFGIENEIKIKKMLILLIVLAAVFFSHIFVFIAAVIFMGTHSVIYLILNFKTIKEEKFKWVFNRCINLLVPSIIFIILTAAYFIKRPASGQETSLKTEEINASLLDLAPLQAFGEGMAYGRGLFYVIYALIILSIGKRIFLFKKEEGIKSFFKITDVFLLLCGLFIYLTYTQPNEDGYGGFITIRMILFAYFFLVMWLAVNDIGKKLSVFILLFYFFFFIKLNSTIRRCMRFSNDQLKKIELCVAKIEPNKTLAPFYFAEYLWQGVHFQNYFGAEKPLVVLDNYEASTKYFPVLWNEEKIPEIRVGSRSVEGFCVFWKTGKRPKWENADYILIFGEKPGDPCYDEVTKLVMENYLAVANDHDVTLYKLK